MWTMTFRRLVMSADLRRGRQRTRRRGSAAWGAARQRRAKSRSRGASPLHAHARRLHFSRASDCVVIAERLVHHDPAVLEPQGDGVTLYELPLRRRDALGRATCQAGLLKRVLTGAQDLDAEDHRL